MTSARDDDPGSFPRLARLLKANALAPPQRWTASRRFASAPVATLLVFLVQLLLFPDPGIAPFVFMYVAPVLAAWFGGRLPGLLAVMLSAAVANFAFLEPRWAWSTSGPALTATALFIFGASVVALLCASFRESVIRAQESEEALREANLQLAEGDRRKDEFLALLSHELRNPLAPIKNSLYVLEHAAPGGEQARRAHAVIDRQVSHLTRLVADLLDVSRISRGKIRLQCERIDLREVVSRTLEDHRSVFVARGIAIDDELPEHPVWVDGDATRLGQALGNLLLNAAKFTNEGGAVSVLLRLKGQTAVLRVRDTGVGIAPDMLGGIFQAFIQADRTLEHSSGGLGLGLALVKGVIELHGGEVAARSEGVGKGAEFTLALPGRPGPAAAAPPEPEAERQARRVLVIEDNEDAAESLKEALVLDEHEVALAFDGPHGLEKARSFKPEVVLCDIGLPGMDGYAVARAFRSDDELHHISLVALTGYALPEDVRKAKAAGFDRHLAKPPDLGALERILAELPLRERA